MNFETNLPVKQLNGPGVDHVARLPFYTALGAGPAELFRPQQTISPIPQGGTFQLEIPLNTFK
jgi:hypothetical protein